MGGLNLLDFKIHYKATIIETMFLEHGFGTRSAERVQRPCPQVTAWITSEVSLPFPEEKYGFYNKWCWSIFYVHEYK